jgi:predicted lipoprotein
VRLAGRATLLVAILALALSRTHPTYAETDHAVIAKSSLTEVIRPGYSTLSAATGTLKDKVVTLCKQPSANALQDAKTAFAGAVEAWSKVEIFRFGPVTLDHRYERLFYWPAPRGSGCGRYNRN